MPLPASFLERLYIRRREELRFGRGGGKHEKLPDRGLRSLRKWSR